MRHARLDTLLLAGMGTLAVHEVAYVPGSIRMSVAGTGVSHSHLPLLWGVVGSLAVVALLRSVIGALRNRPGHRAIDSRWLGAAMAALYTSQEAAERALSGTPAITLLTSPALWVGLAMVPLVAVLLARLVSCVASLMALSPDAPAPRSASAAWFVRRDRLSPARLQLLAHSVVTRGPPASLAH